MSNASPKPPARRWPWIVGGTVAIVAAVGAWAYFAPATVENVPSATATAVPTASPTASAAPVSTFSPSPITIEAPTGCLGGTGRDADMVLTAVAQAPDTSSGAVEVAAAFMRWIHQYPVPAAADAQRVQDVAIDTSTGTDAVASFAANPNLSGGAAADGEAFYLSTAPGVYYLDSFTEDTATVTIGTGIVLNGALDPIHHQGQTYVLRWVDAHWMLVDAYPTDRPAELFTIGTAFTGGC
ncbi:hypothetical protein HQQ81_21035 [Microbacteriaceae bacterium VKM Ac-2854]|nr:hypothetical protein [Microbacteriaceae bacterium VKM Ac-2854]